MCILTSPPSSTLWLPLLLPPSSCSIFLSSRPPSPPPPLSPPSLQIAKLAGRFGPDRLASLWSCCGLVASSFNNVCICLSQHPIFELFKTYSLQSAHNCPYYNVFFLRFVRLLWIYPCERLRCLYFLYSSMSLQLQMVCPCLVLVHFVPNRVTH